MQDVIEQTAPTGLDLGEIKAEADGADVISFPSKTDVGEKTDERQANA